MKSLLNVVWSITFGTFKQTVAVPVNCADEESRRISCLAG
jgi:hypothetical protein